MLIRFTIIILLISFTNIIYAQQALPDRNLVKNTKNKSDYNYKVDRLHDELAMIKANQINYRIEKDLLKETYSNNYERINTVITAILGFVALLGFLGIKDISKIKTQYNNELSKLRKLKIKFEAKSKEFDNDIKEIEENVIYII